MAMLTAFVLAGLWSSALGVPSQAGRALRLFSTHRAPSYFERTGDAPQEHRFDLQISLTRPRMRELEEVAYAIADPANPRYGAHLTKEQSDAYSAPHPNSIAAVAQWLESHDLKGRWTEASDRVVVPNVPVSKASEMLGATYGTFRHESGAEMVRTEQYSLPKDLHQHVGFVQPTNSFFRNAFGDIGGDRKKAIAERIVATGAAHGDDLHQRKRTQAAAPPACTNASYVEIPCVRQLYNTEDYVPQAVSKGRVGTSGFIGEHASTADFKAAIRRQRPDQATYMFSAVGISGGVNTQEPSWWRETTFHGLEANLDTQLTAGMAAPIPSVFYSVGPEIPSEADLLRTFDNLFDYLLALPDSELPSTISTSYGGDEQAMPFSLASDLCNKIAQVGARGVSVLFASGDNGVGYCPQNDTSQFLPTFPPTCPFATSVAATQKFAPEEAVGYDVAGYSAGGGFSNYWPIQSYQTADVSSYIAGLNGTYAGKFNTTGRGFPDVSAQGTMNVANWAGYTMGLGGTSAASPIFAAIVGLLNDYQLSRGKPTLGFLNPWLYSIGRKGFNDITLGSNAGCATNGFPAGPGWDAATGLGTPDFKQLLALLP